MIQLGGEPDSERLPLSRWACMLALLIVEFIVISLRYDAREIGHDRALHGLIMHAGVAVRVGSVIGLATLMVIGRGCHSLLKQHAKLLGHWRLYVPVIVGNLLAFSLFYGLSGRVLEGNRSAYSDEVLIVAWGLSALATLVFWAAACLPARLWVLLVRESGWGLAVGPALGAIACLAGSLARDQWKTLSYATFWLVARILEPVFPDTICEPAQRLVGTSTFQVTIAPACSGYEGMGLIASLLALSLWLFRRDFRFPRALILLPVGAALIWLANAFRIAALIALGTCGYPELAVGGFHSLAGWVSFLLIGLTLIAWARSSTFFLKARDTRSFDCGSAARLDGAYLVPAMAIIATAMVTTSLSPGFDRYYAARVIITSMVLLFYRNSYSELRLGWSWHAVAIGSGVFALWMVLEPASAGQSGGVPIRSGLNSLASAWGALWLFFRVAGSVVTVPIAEELAFRGYLTRRLMATDFQTIPPGRMNWWSLVISSVLFGALHGRWFAGTLAGMAYALAYRRRGALTDAILAHAVTNGLIAAMVFTTGNWSLWS